MANSDSKEPVRVEFEAFIARAVRILPMSWNSYVGGRFELFVSKTIYEKVLPSDSLISAVSAGFKVTSSGCFDNACGLSKIGIDIQFADFGCGGWCAGISDQNQWIMITSVKPVMWKKISTLGDKKFEQWIKSYYIMYSIDGLTWLEYKNKQVVTANFDKDTKVE